MFTTGRLLKIASVGILAFCSSMYSFAQQVNPGTDTGVPLYGSYSGGSLDTINIQNGNLHIEIPLFSVKERGRTFVWKYIYDPMSFERTWDPQPTPQDAGNGTYLTGPVNDVSGWRLSGPLSWHLGFVQQTQTCATNGQQYNAETQFYLEDPEGTKHQLPLYEEGDGSQDVCNPQVLSGPSLDGSGIVVTLTPGKSALQNWTAVLKDGTTIQETPGSLTLTDTNGNVATLSTDMLGRSMPFATSFSYKDSNGATQSFSVQSATFNVQTSLCGGTSPYPCTEYTTTQSMPVKLILPDSTSYQFSYQNNSEVQLAQIILPTGASISYSNSLASTQQPDGGHHPTIVQRPVVTSRTVSVGGSNFQWLYGPCSGVSATCVTDPEGNQQAHTFNKVTIGNDCSAGPVETSVAYYQGSAGSGTLLKTTSRTWTGDDETAINNFPCGSLVVNLRVTSEITTLDSGQSSQVQTDYETFPWGSFTMSRLNPTEKREYDFGGALVRKTDYAYLHTNNQAYQNLNIVDRVASVTVYNGSGAQMAQTTNEYDNYTQGIAATSAVQHSSSFSSGYLTRGNLTAVTKWRNTDGVLLTTRNQYNDVGESIATTDPKGHTTSYDYSDSWSNTTCAPATGSAEAYVKKITNALGQTAAFTYDSCTGLVASSTDANSQTTTSTYDLFGRPVLTSRPDGGHTSVCYTDDPSGSCYSSSLPLKIITTKALTSGTNLVTTSVLDGLGRVAQAQTNSDPQGTDYIDTTYDGLGRVSSVSNPYRSTTDPTYGVTSYSYDGLNRKTQVTQSDNSVIATAYSGNSTTVTDEAGHPRRSFTDALGRLIEVDEPGGLPSGPNGTSATGSVTISGGERSKQIFPPGCRMRSCAETIYDFGSVSVTVNGFTESASYGQGDTVAGLASQIANEFNNAGSSSVNASVSGGVISFTSRATGQNTNYPLSASSVTDDPSDFSTPSFTTATSGSTLTGGTGGSGGISPLSMSTPFQTFYSYDALGNLLQVQQHGLDGNSADWRTRSFSYDSLSELLTSTNPETGAVTYTYDNDGNVATKTDARGITITNSYDALNRVSGVTYSNGDPSVTYSYDGSNCLSQPSCHNIGHRTGMTDAAGSEAWSYDSMDRVLADQRTTNGITKSTIYAYSPYLDGSVASITYPSGLKVTYAYDGVGRPVSAIDQNGVKYAASASYAPQDAISSAVIGVSGAFTGITVSSTYNKRLQPVEVKASSSASTPLDLTYNFNLGAGDNGTVVAITNNLDSTRNQVFTYDALNRLVVAGTQSTSGTNCWGEEYSYDAWANLFQISPPAGYSGCQVETLSILVSANNQVGSFSYDGAGNVANDNHNAYTWDAESEVKTAAGVTYSYDGLGNRIEKSNGTLYWFGMGSEALEETDLSGNLKNDYVFFGGKRIARHTASANYYYVEDHLGSSRVITDASGNKCYDADFYPFGGELTFTNTCAQNYKFTGKERDAETGNDNFGARYYSSSFGRFLSPDWSAIPEPVPYANLTNPQTLNLYQYVEDDPESYADLDGHAGDQTNGQSTGQSAQTSLTTCTLEVPGSTGSSTCTATSVNADNSTQVKDDTEKTAGLLATIETKIDVTMKEVDAVAKPLIESAAENGAKALPEIVDVGSKVLGPLVGVLTILDPQRPIARDEDYLNSTHKKGARPSTEEKHEGGASRRKRDAGGEKGDKARQDKGMWPRRRPPGHKGPWPPKNQDGGAS